MLHPLWSSNEWNTASDEEIISALFNAPQHPDPKGMGYIKQNRPHLIGIYKAMFNQQK